MVFHPLPLHETTKTIEELQDRGIHDRYQTPSQIAEGRSGSGTISSEASVFQECGVTKLRVCRPFGHLRFVSGSERLKLLEGGGGPASKRFPRVEPVEKLIEEIVGPACWNLNSPNFRMVWVGSFRRKKSWREPFPWSACWRPKLAFEDSLIHSFRNELGRARNTGLLSLRPRIFKLPILNI